MYVKTARSRPGNYTVFNMAQNTIDKRKKTPVHCLICEWDFRPKDAKDRERAICPDHSEKQIKKYEDKLEAKNNE